MLGVSFRAMMRKPVSDPSAWKVIDSVTLGSAASSVSFTGIDTTYRMFRVTAYIVRASTPIDVNFSLNNDTTNANYSRQTLLGYSTTVDASRNTGSSIVARRITTDTGIAETGTIELVIAKQIAGAAAMVLTSSTESNMNIVTGANAIRWNNTSDLINRIDLIGSGDFAAGTTVVLEAI